MLQLIVTSPFGGYAVGTIITDPAIVAAIVAGPDRRCVIEEVLGGHGGGTETLTLGVIAAVATLPLSLAGEIAGGPPRALDWSTDAGVTWTPVGSFALAGGSWGGTGPIYGAAHNGVIVVRDNGAPGVVSAPVSFSVPALGAPPLRGTLTLGDGSLIDSIGTGLLAPQATGSGAGALSVAFGTLSGLVADGGSLSLETQQRNAAGLVQSAALSAETGARTAVDAAAATALASVQALAAAALPAGLRGVAGGVAPLDANALVPAANLPSPYLPSVASLAWTDVAGTPAIFHRGPVPVPAASRTGMLVADRAKLAGEYNFAEIWDTQTTYDAWPVLQNFLLYCQLMALAAKTSAIDNIGERNSVRAVLPRGAYLISQPLTVPEFVDLDCRGTLYRAAYTGNQSNDGITSFPGPFATNQFLPTVVITPRAHARNLNIYVNTDNAIAHRGSGVCIGKTWAAQVGAACTVGNTGTGYSVGDMLYMTQPSVGPYYNWAAQVTAISGGGTTGPIAAAVVSAAGAYALPPATYNSGPSLQQQQWTAANGFANILDPAHPGCFLVRVAYRADQHTPSPGSGATLAPLWQADYMAGVAAYNIGSAITNGSQIGKIQITGGIPSIIDATHGPTFGVMVTGLETVIAEIQVLGGNAGVYGYFAQDVRIGIINVVEAGVGLELFGCGSWHCPLAVYDTCGAALLINQTQGVRFGFRAFFEQNNIGLLNAYPNSLGNAVIIGNASSATFPCSDIHLDGALINMGGLPQTTITANPGTAVGGQTPRPMAASLSLAWLFGSALRIKVSNTGEQGGLPTILPTSGFCQFGQGVAPGNTVEGMIDMVPIIDGVAPPAQMVTLTAGHGFPNCALRLWDGMHDGWIGPGGIADLFGTAAPVNGATGTGAGFAVAGSSYTSTASGAGRRFVNTGTQAVPAWN